MAKANLETVVIAPPVEAVIEKTVILRLSLEEARSLQKVLGTTGYDINENSGVAPIWNALLEVPEVGNLCGDKYSIQRYN